MVLLWRHGHRLITAALAIVCTQVAGPPSFLDPEATRPLAIAAQHTAVAAAGGSGADGGGGAGGGKVKSAAGPEFDIATLAPPLKGTQQ